jgi:L-lactate dehydrogenase complex protein LldF
LERLEKKCTQNGIKVHWAETIPEANQLVLDIMKSHGATRLVKGKSMVSEEMELNAYLQKNGIEALETDLGEFIIQLNHETPAHIIVPAIHKNRDQISKIFHDNIPDAPYTENIDELNAIARKTLRQKFKKADVGLSGVNFAVAETGTLCLVENEGNGRMCTTVPGVHIALMGLEKVVEKLEDLPPMLRLLIGSATRSSSDHPGQRPLKNLYRRPATPDPLLHSLRDLPQPLSGIQSNWGSCLRLYLSGAHRQDFEPAG